MQWPIKVQGREVGEKKVRWLSGWIAEHFHWSRRRLAGELCVLWDWRDGSERAKDFAARSFLLKMEERGWIVLTPLRDFLDGFYADVVLQKLSEEPQHISVALDDVGFADAYLVAVCDQLCRL